MEQWLKKYFEDDKGCGCGSLHEEGCGCGCGCHGHEEDEEDPIIEVVDPESGETYQFYYADEFDFEGKEYCVLVTMDDDDPEYVIAQKVVDEKGESYIETLDEENSDPIYEAYEALLQDYFDEDDDEEGKEEPEA